MIEQLQLFDVHLYGTAVTLSQIPLPSVQLNPLIISKADIKKALLIRGLYQTLVVLGRTVDVFHAAYKSNVY